MITEPTIIDLPKINDPRGNLTFLQESAQVPFNIERVYWIYDVPGGQIRGSHAFLSQYEILIAMSGSFTVQVEHNGIKQSYTLNRSYKALILPPGSWRTIEDFSTNSLCLVLSSTHYNEDDYIRDYDSFLNTSFETTLPTIFDRSKEPLKPKLPSIYEANLIELPTILDTNGSISVVEGNQTLPYNIKRVYYLYDIPNSAERGAHAHKECHRFLIAASGAFDVSVSDGKTTRWIRLERPNYGLYVPPGLWTAINGFSSGSICVSLASDLYSEADYIREFDEYLNYKETQND